MAKQVESNDLPIYTILEADGQHDDNILEENIFNRNPTRAYKVHFIRSDLSPSNSDIRRPWTSLPKELRDRVDGIMTLKMYLTAEDLELFPSLKVVVRMGVGYDRIDRVALANRGITLCNVPDYGTEEIADHAIGLALSLRRGILLHHDRQREPILAAYYPVDSPLVRRSRGAIFGILGLGRIGTAAALRAKAFGFHVLFYDPYLSNGADKAIGCERTKDIKELFRRSSILSIHCPCTRVTRQMVGYDLLSLLPKGAVLINTGRGEIVDLDAVEQCLKENILAGAGLDVLPVEPPIEPVHSLIQAYRKREEWLSGRLVLTCHTAFYSPASVDEIREKSAITMREVLIDGLQSNVITPDME